MEDEKRSLRKEIKEIKERMSEIEIEVVNLSDDIDLEYKKNIEAEYEQLTGDLAELEKLKKSKSSWKKYVIGFLAIATALISCITILIKVIRKRKK